MPFLQNEDEELKQQNAGQISGPSAGPMSSGGPQKAPSAKSSGSWTNLQTYMNANKDNATQMGQAVAKSADTAGESASKQVQGFQSKVPTEVRSYTPESVQSSFYDNPNATKEQYQQFKTTGGYTGPSSLEDMGYGATESAVKKANEAVGNIQTEQGRQTTLGELYKKPSYSAGQKTFDNLLLQNSPEARSAAEGVAQKWGGLTNMLSGAKDQASVLIPKNLATAASNQQVANTAEQSYLDNFYNTLDAQAKSKNAENAATQAKFQGDLSNNVLSPETMALLGLSNNQNIYDLNLSNYLAPNTTQLGAKDVATEEQRQKWGKLLGLMGRTDERLVGTPISVNPITADSSKLQSDIASRGSVLDKEINDLMGKYYGGGSGGGFSQTASGSMQEMLNMGLTPDEYIAYKDKYTPFGWSGNADQLRADYSRLNQINKKVNSTASNAITRPSGTITGSLKG